MILTSPSDRQDLSHAFRHSALSALDPTDATVFDDELLKHLRMRTAPRFFFEHERAEQLGLQIVENRPAEAKLVVDKADKVLRHLFPSRDQAGEDYVSQLPDIIDWSDNPTDEPHFTYTLNRHRFWPELAMAYRFTGNRCYLDELQRQIVSWCGQSPPLASPDDWQNIRPSWHLLDAAIRGDTWIWTLFLAITADEWQAEVNTLFVHRLLVHARFLRHLTPRSGTYWAPNWLIMQAQGLLNIALMFPEFDESAEWAEHAITVLHLCTQAQFFPDGGHCEQSPIYHEACLRWIAEPLYLNRINAGVISDECWSQLEKSAEFIYQLTMPDGTLPALSDSDRAAGGMLTQMGVFFSRPDWMRYRAPSARDCWFFGGAETATTASTEARPTAVAFPDAGYYVMRSGDSLDSHQLVFDCGVSGLGHGHFDLLSFDLYGMGRPQIADPGRLVYADTPERKWVMSTAAHNTICLDGANHNRIERDQAGRIHLTAWEVTAGSVLVSGWHEGYRDLAGAPRVGRTIWFDRRSTFVIADWVSAAAEHDVAVSFTVPNASGAAVTDLAQISGENGSIAILPKLQPGQIACMRPTIYSPNYGESEPATLLTVSQRSSQCVFVTVVSIFDGSVGKRIHQEPGISVQNGIVSLRLDDADNATAICLEPPFCWN